MEPAESAPKPARRRRWWKILLAVVLVLVVIVVVAPFVASPFVKRAVIGALEEKFDAQASIEELALRLPGRLRLRGLALESAEGTLARVESVEASASLPSLLTGALDVAVTVDGFVVQARVDEQGRWDWKELRREKKEKERDSDDEKDAEDRDAPTVKARVDVKNGRVVLAGPAGRFELRNIELDATVDGLERPSPIALRTELFGTDGPAGSLSLQGVVTAASAGRLEPAGVRAELQLAAEDVRLAALEPVLSASLPLEALAGRLDGRAELTLAEGFALLGHGEGQVAELSLRGPIADSEPVTVAVVALRFVGERGVGTASTQRFELTLDDFLALRWDGQTTIGADGAGELGAELTLDGDVTRLARIASGWVPVERGLDFSGRLEGRTRLSTAWHGGAPRNLALESSFDLRGLAARDAEGQPVDLGELASSRLGLVIDADLERGAVAWRDLDATLGPVSLRGAGQVEGLAGRGERRLVLGESSLTFTADLGRLRASLARVLDLGPLQMRGRMDGELSARPGAAGGSAVELAGRFDVADLLVATAPGEPGLEIRALGTELSGSHDAEADRVELRELRCTSDFLQLAGRGACTAPADAAARQLELDGELELDPTRLGEALAGFLGTSRLEGTPLTGTFAVRGHGPALGVELAARSERLQLARADKAPMRQESVELNLAADLADGTVELRRAELRSSSVTADVTGRWAGPAAPETQLTLTLAAPLQQLLAELGLEQPTPERSLAGDLDVRAEATGGAEALALSGTARIKELHVTTRLEGREEPFTLHDPNVELAWKARVQPEATADGAPDGARAALIVEVERFELDSELARGSAQGRATRISGATPEAPAELLLEDVAGELAYVPERVAALLGPWLPGKLSGAEEERVSFAFSGRAEELDLAHLLAGASGKADVGLGRFEAAGFDTKGRLGLELAGGTTSFDGDWQANGGELSLDGVIALEDATAEPGAAEAPKTRLAARLKEVQANSQLAPLLAKLHPAFAAVESVQEGRIEGLIDCELELFYDGALGADALEGGWEALPKEPIRGRGRFEIRGLKLAGSPLLAQMLGELGVDPKQGFDLRPLTFLVDRGRVSYDDPWTWTIGGTETSFTGSIGLDETLQLAWNVPVSEKLIERYGFLASLAGQTIEVPIGGTVKRPRLEWKDTLTDLAKRLATSELTERLGLPGVPGKDPAADPEELLRRADELWDRGEKAEAAKLYEELHDDHKVSLVYLLNRDKIKDRSKWKPK